MSKEHAEQDPPMAEQQAATSIASELLEYDTPWTPPLGTDNKHKLCQAMLDAFSDHDYDKTQDLAHLLLIHGNLPFRVYAHLVLAYGIKYGLSHAQQAVEVAEFVARAMKEDSGAAKLLDLAQRTLVLIEAQDAAMEEDGSLSDIDEEEEIEEAVAGKEIIESNDSNEVNEANENNEADEVIEAKEGNGANEGKEAKEVNETKETQEEKEAREAKEKALRDRLAAAIAAWDFKAIKAGTWRKPDKPSHS